MESNLEEAPEILGLMRKSSGLSILSDPFPLEPACSVFRQYNSHHLLRVCHVPGLMLRTFRYLI